MRPTAGRRCAVRPLRLDLAGFAVFREETTVDFTGADFFALVGPTGAGKSTVLDAICFALYGTVPRWVDRRSVANALAPSCPEARVRLIFESAGRRYAAARVVRRVGRAGTRVETAHAGLERLPEGFTLASLDDGLTELGEVLAGTPGEMEQAVTEAIGLPYEQFVTCVVLPQGQFAQFLHAKGAQRQQILVNLLGLHVYERVRERAGQLHRDAEQRGAALAQVLGDMSDVDGATLDAATDRLATVRRLGTAVDGILPELEAALAATGEARQALQRLDAEVTRLGAVRPPADATEVATAAAQAHDAAQRAGTQVTGAEEAEVRDELATQPDAVRLRQALDGYAERDRLAPEAARYADLIDAAETELTAARDALTSADAELAAAEAALQHAQAEDLAAGVRAHLVAGEPCPVCRQQVDRLPGDAPPVALADAKARRRARDTEVRDLERSLTQARAHHDRVTARLAELTAALDGSDGPDALTATLQAIEALTARARQAAAAVREARERHRRARAAEDHTHSAVRDAWRSFDRVRDELRRLAERREQAAALRDQLAEHTARAQVAKALANHLKSTNFERWLLEEALDLLVGGASEILRQLSGGQYDLVHDKGEFVVVDHHDADLHRAVRTLSGGETFQASLALALALSEQLAGMSTSAASLESIMLDEGFGTLDAGTLDVVAATLENLAARGDRMVGVVTHVPALAERIPVRFEVTKDARTARVERVG